MLNFYRLPRTNGTIVQWLFVENSRIQLDNYRLLVLLSKYCKLLIRIPNIQKKKISKSLKLIKAAFV